MINIFIIDDVSSSASKKEALGSALGPDWAEGLSMKGAKQV